MEAGLNVKRIAKLIAKLIALAQDNIQKLD
jgi:hypothetical protein